MSSHSATAMGDQVFVYKLNKTNGWSVTTRDASIKQIKAATGTALGVSWSSNVVTLTNTMTADDMPMSSSDATTVKSSIDTLNSKIKTVVRDLSSWQFNNIINLGFHSHVQVLGINVLSYAMVPYTMGTVNYAIVFDAAGNHVTSGTIEGVHITYMEES
jgi:hypothetical protein